MPDTPQADASGWSADAGVRFGQGFAARAAIDPQLLARPGTTVLAREDRAGTGAVACYRIDRRLILWADPAVADRLAGLEAQGHTMEPEPLAAALGAAGFVHRADVESRVLPSGAEAAALAVVALAPPTGHRQRGERAERRRLRFDDESHVAMVRRFVDRCDPDDVEAAALDEIDDFDEAAINVVMATAASTEPPGATGSVGPAVDPSRIVAYASASEWDWDHNFGDIGVLVDRAHRGGGLGRLVVAHTVADLLADGRRPLYRHERANHGSRRIALGLGFEQAAALAYYTLASD